MKKTDLIFSVSGYKRLGKAAVWALSLLGVMLGVALPAGASSPTGHIIIAEKIMERIMNDPNANPELKAILSDPDARRAFSGGACAPDLDTVSDMAHSDDPKWVADKIMEAARNKLDKAEAALATATTPEQQAAAERVIHQATCDVAFAYGWRTHAAADLETHPTVNASGENYWEDSDKIDKAWHGEWETMQEVCWVDRSGWPKDPNVDYRLGLLENVFGFDHNKLTDDVQTLSWKETGALEVGNKYTDTQLDQWKVVNDGIFDRSVDRGCGYVNSPANPLDDSCWDIGVGMTLDEFQKFEEETRKNNGGNLPEGFWVGYPEMFDKWKRSQGGAAGGTGGAGTAPPLLPPPLSGGLPGSAGSGASGGTTGVSGGTPQLNTFR